MNALQDSIEEKNGSVEEKRAALIEGLKFEAITHTSVFSWIHLFQEIKSVMEEDWNNHCHEKRRKRICVHVLEECFDDDDARVTEQ